MIVFTPYFIVIIFIMKSYDNMVEQMSEIKTLSISFTISIYQLSQFTTFIINIHLICISINRHYKTEIESLLRVNIFTEQWFILLINNKLFLFPEPGG